MKSLNKIGENIGWNIANSIDVTAYLIAFVLVVFLMFNS